MRGPSRLVAPITVVVLAVGLAPASPAGATSKTVAATGIASATPAGAAGGWTSTGADVSANGRFIAFQSAATNLVTGDTNNKTDVFVRDTLAATTVRVSVGPNGTQGDGSSAYASISDDGRYVAFESSSTNLVPGDTNADPDVFRYDLRTKQTLRVSLTTDDLQVEGRSGRPAISADGSLVAFESESGQLIVNDTNVKTDVFVRDLAATTTARVSVAAAGVELTAGGTGPAITGDGRYVTFESATSQIADDNNVAVDVFVRDRTAATTEKASLTDGEGHANSASQVGDISDDGRYVVFQSNATNLVTGDANADYDVFVRDRTAATTQLISTTQGTTTPGNKGSTAPSISADGDRVAFSSIATDLVGGDTNNTSDVFVKDRSDGSTTRQSRSTGGTPTNGVSYDAAISDDGTVTAFATLATNLEVPDANTTYDVWWRGTYERGPFATLGALVTRQHQDFLGRAPTSAELSERSRRISTGLDSSPSSIDDLAHGAFDDHRGPVTRLYWAFFKRLPDLSGFNFWVNQFKGGRSLTSIANAFAQSSEFLNTYGDTTDTEYVALVYNNVLDRSPDAAGIAYWVAQLGSGVTRGQMMGGFSESNEGKRLRRPVVDAVLVHLGMLHRLPTADEVDAATTLLAAPANAPTEVLIAQILTSAAYAAIT